MTPTQRPSGFDLLANARKVLIYETIPWGWHFGTALEIADLCLDNGADVVFAHTACDLPYVEGEPYPLPPGNRLRIKCSVQRGLALLQRPVVSHIGIPQDILHAAEAEQPPVPSNLTTLMTQQHRHMDLGMGVASSLISDTKNAQFDVGANRQLVADALRSAVITAIHADRLLEQHAPDVMVLFNGRFGTIRPARRAAERRRVPVVFHERGSSRAKFFLFTRPPHDMAYLQAEMRRAWEEHADAEEREHAARQFFEERRAGREQGWSSFVTNQVAGSLPTDWSRTRRNFVYFSSSDDEFAAIGDGLSPALFSDQFEAIRQVATLIASERNAHLTVRIHPHLAKKHASEQRRWQTLTELGVTLVAPASPISTYTLIDNADVVVTFNSTVGVEATFWGRPSISLGPSYYSTLDVAYRPASKDELTQLVRAPSLHPKPISGALIYGFFFKSFGVPFKRFKVTRLNWGEYRGIDVWKPSTFAEYVLYRRAVLARSFNKRWVKFEAALQRQP